MPTLQALLSVTFAGLALSATPGPSMLYVFSQTVGQSRMAGLASAVGLCIGGILLAIATAFGLATLFARFEWLVTGLRFAGAAYLIWLGVDMISGASESARKTLNAEVVEKKPVRKVVFQGILVELLNPKTVLFFALFLPPFVASGQGSWDGSGTLTQLLILGSLVPLTALPADIAVALLGGSLTSKMQESFGLRKAMSRCGGLLLIAIAVGMILPFIRG